MRLWLIVKIDVYEAILQLLPPPVEMSSLLWPSITFNSCPYLPLPTHTHTHVWHVNMPLLTKGISLRVCDEGSAFRTCCRCSRWPAAWSSKDFEVVFFWRHFFLRIWKIWYIHASLRVNEGMRKRFKLTCASRAVVKTNLPYLEPRPSSARFEFKFMSKSRVQRCLNQY